MVILGLETSTEACSVALNNGGEITVSEVVAPREHGKLLLPAVESLLAASGLSRSTLDAVAFGRGPGAFTGVRMAVAVAQGLAYGLDRPTLPVSTLAALAKTDYDQFKTPHVITAIDARMGEVYFAAWHCPTMDCIADEAVVAPDRVPRPEGDSWRGVGSGFDAYAAPLQERLQGLLSTTRAEALPSARAIVQLGAKLLEAGGAVPAGEAAPVYLRDQVAHVKPASR